MLIERRPVSRTVPADAVGAATVKDAKAPQLLVCAIPLFEGSSVAGALLLEQRPAPAPDASAGGRGSCADAFPVQLLLPSPLLSSPSTLHQLGLTVSVCLGADTEALRWMAGALSRLAAAPSMHSLVVELCDALASHVRRRFIVTGAVRAALLPRPDALCALMFNAQPLSLAALLASGQKLLRSCRSSMESALVGPGTPLVSARQHGSGPGAGVGPIHSHGKLTVMLGSDCGTAATAMGRLSRQPASSLPWTDTSRTTSSRVLQLTQAEAGAGPSPAGAPGSARPNTATGMLETGGGGGGGASYFAMTTRSIVVPLPPCLLAAEAAGAGPGPPVAPGLLAQAFPARHTLLGSIVAGAAARSAPVSLEPAASGEASGLGGRSSGERGSGGGAAATGCGLEAEGLPGCVVEDVSSYIQGVHNPSRDLLLLNTARQMGALSLSTNSPRAINPGAAAAAAAANGGLATGPAAAASGASQTAGSQLNATGGPLQSVVLVGLALGEAVVGLYVGFGKRLPGELLEAVRGSCAELVQMMFAGPVSRKLSGSLAAEFATLCSATPGSFAVLRSPSANGAASSLGSAPSLPSAAILKAARPHVSPFAPPHVGCQAGAATAPVPAVDASVPLPACLTVAGRSMGALTPRVPGGSCLSPARRPESTVAVPLAAVMAAAALAGPTAGGVRTGGTGPVGAVMARGGSVDLCLSGAYGSHDQEGGAKTPRGPPAVRTASFTSRQLAASFSRHRTPKASASQMQMQALAVAAAAAANASASTAGGASTGGGGAGAGGATPLNHNEDLLSVLLHMQASDAPSGAGEAAGGSASIMTVTGVDPGASMKQQLDLLVTSIHTTMTADQPTGGAPFSDELEALEMEEVLGKGGGGVVYRGRMGTLEVAVKVMELPDMDAGEGLRGEGSSGTAGHVPAPGPGDKAEPKTGPAGARPGPSLLDPASAAAVAREQLRARRTLLRNALEMAVQGRVSHPNIIQVFSTYTNVAVERRVRADGTHCSVLVPAEAHTNDSALALPGLPPHTPCCAIVTEFADGGSLAAALSSRRFPRFLPSSSLGGGIAEMHMFHVDLKGIYMTLLDVALALRHLHSMNLVHRDIKPANLLLKSNPRDHRGFTVKLADFGFVLHLNEASDDGSRFANVDQACGTVTHMAPELLPGKARVEPSADVYSFGIVMWELVSGGGRPFPHLHPDHIPRHVYRGARPSFNDQLVPLSYRGLAQACWAHDPARRPKAADLVGVINAHLAELE
ncbi:hypothetical protein HYH03_006214 [Edaphochlamys debaryana]|uniref:Protein kinase domain-containing protein n=1 Tax=Edaphochlamys debaryana TaxID=47281 RepID=A0A835Y5N9_9CHLO|nr:hypothetical protein HYH03_006214 [Edaphochlamys debaryana]|eukprot:KAG2495614.1 hypothetical protein HYH03_006214 [Edaphochlamys debaryana]